MQRSDFMARKRSNNRKSKSSDFSSKMKIKFGYNFLVFIIFFGVSFYEAFFNMDITGSLFWIAIAIFFLMADNFVK